MNTQNIEKTLTVGSFASRRTSFKFSFFPSLRLRGKWLQNAGFTPGAKFQVKTNGNSLVITPLND